MQANNSHLLHNIGSLTISEYKWEVTEVTSRRVTGEGTAPHRDIRLIWVLLPCLSCDDQCWLVGSLLLYKHTNVLKLPLKVTLNLCMIDFPSKNSVTTGCTIVSDVIQWGHWDYLVWCGCEIDSNYGRGEGGMEYVRVVAQCTNN